MLQREYADLRAAMAAIAVGDALSLWDFYCLTVQLPSDHHFDQLKDQHL